MILCLDIGNSQIFGGVFEGDKLKFRFRKRSDGTSSSDEYGVFLRNVLRENEIDPDAIHKIAIATVVPDVLHSIKNCCLKYFNISPFVLQAGIKSGLNIKYRNPLEVGADRIANSIAAYHYFPNKNIIVIDLGTATTFCAISKNREYLGGAIIPGLRISMEALELKTAKLPKVEIIKPESALGRSTIENIQSGLYYSHIGAAKYISEKLAEECFPNDPPIILGTGGFSSLYENEDLFNAIIPDLVLNGLYLALSLNPQQTKMQNSVSTEVRRHL